MDKKMYRYEMHCHTIETSKCAIVKAADLVDHYKHIGFDGVVITDHFLNGNTIVPRDLPWAERIEQYTLGYRNAKKRGDEIGLDVFFAWEFSAGGGSDFLTYGLDVDWLLAHENVDKMKINDYADLVHGDGGYLVHAHPFREAAYIDMIRLVPRKVDAVEIVNACRSEFENRMAAQYADNYNLHAFCGTDNHSGIRPSIAALEIPFRAKNTAEILEAVLREEQSIELLKFDKPYTEITETVKIKKNVIRDETK